MALGAIHSGWAEASLFIIIGSIVFSVLACLCLCFCYYPGGRKRSEVMDVGVLPLYNVSYQQHQKEEEEEDWAESEAGVGPNRDEDMYQDAPHGQADRPAPLDTRDDLYAEELPVRRDVQMLSI